MFGLVSKKKYRILRDKYIKSLDDHMESIDESIKLVNKLLVANNDIQELLKKAIDSTLKLESFEQGTIDFIKAIYDWNDILDTTQLQDRIISDVLMVGLMDTLYEKLYIPEDLNEEIYEINKQSK